MTVVCWWDSVAREVPDHPREGGNLFVPRRSGSKRLCFCSAGYSWSPWPKGSFASCNQLFGWGLELLSGLQWWIFGWFVYSGEGGIVCIYHRLRFNSTASSLWCILNTSIGGSDYISWDTLFGSTSSTAGSDSYLVGGGRNGQFSLDKQLFLFSRRY